LSPSGIFIFRRISRSSKSSFTLKLALPDGKKIAIRGRMVRAFRVPPQLRRSVPSGFCVRLMDAQEEYFAYLANLFGVRFADDAETAQLPADEEAEVVEPVAACGGDVLT
jgi:hypothetical protein